MLLHLFDRILAILPAAVWSGDPAALEKITFRASLAAVAGFAMAIVLGPRLIGWLRRRFREPIKSDSAHVRFLHQDKQATPTMGGLFIIAGLVAALVAFGDLENRYLQTALVVTLGLTALGAVDDLTKLRGSSGGISARAKLAGQFVVALVAALMVYQHQSATGLSAPADGGLTGLSLSLGLWQIPLAVIVIVGSSNAVNLTDGLDGLAGGCLIFATAAMALVAYAAGHVEMAEYLNLPYVAGAGEMTVLAGAMIGGVLGFLWFNCHPAQVFMGDTGSLPLGGLLGLVAVAARQEFLLVLVGGVFVAEALSVIIQVGYYKWRRRRVFLCAPLHHHFQFLGWPESRIVVRFWIASALCAVVGLAGLKLAVNERTPASPSATAQSTTEIEANVKPCDRHESQ